MTALLTRLYVADDHTHISKACTLIRPRPYTSSSTTNQLYYSQIIHLAFFFHHNFNLLLRARYETGLLRRECPSVRSHTSAIMSPNFTKFSVRVACGHCSVVFRWRWDILSSTLATPTKVSDAVASEAYFQFCGRWMHSCLPLIGQSKRRK